MEETALESPQKPLLNRLVDAVNFNDNINYRDPLGWNTLRDRWVNKTIGKDWREEQMSDIWDLLPDEWKPAVKEGATKFGQAFAKGWQDRRTIEGKEFLNPLAYTDFAITRGFETIGIPFEWMAQGISKASGLDIELARIATDFVPVAGIAGAVGKKINKARLAKRISLLQKAPINKTEALRAAIKSGDKLQMEAAIKAITEPSEELARARSLKAKLEDDISAPIPAWERGVTQSNIGRGKYRADATYYKDPITKIERRIPHLIADNLTESRRTLRALSERLGYTDDVVETTARTPRSLVAPAEIGQLYLANVTAYYRKRGNLDGFPALQLSDGTVLRPKIQGTLSRGLKVTFVNPFRDQANRLRSAARRKSDNFEQNPYGPNAFQLKRPEELKGLAEDLDIITNIHGHHLDPLKLGSRFYKGLKEFSKDIKGRFDVDLLIENRAYLTAHLAKKGVFAGNHPLNNWQLPVRVHKGVHDFLKYRLDELGWDEKFWKKIEKLSLEERIPYLNQYADLIIESQDEILRLFKEVAKGRPIPNIEATYWKHRLGPKNYKKIVEDLLSDVDLEGNRIPDDILQQILEAEIPHKRF